MTIKLDGKNNIIDSAYSDLKNYKESTLQITEDEKQKAIKKINDKVIKDWYNKPILKMKKTIESDYETEEVK